MSEREKKKEKPIQTLNTVTFEKGLSSDTLPIAQPKGTYRYALNTVNNSGFLENEESNIPCGFLPQGFVPIGKCYIGDDETCLFLVNPDTDVSEIGIFKNCKYETIVNDEDSRSEYKLNFKITHQIQATYRLRRGCDKTLYFTDNFNPPRYFNLSNPKLFKSEDEWHNLKFNIFRESLKQPDIKTLQVLDSYGSLKPGAYTFLVQYLDEDLNPTQFYELASNIYIYKDPLNSKYEDIEGSIRLGGFKIDSGEAIGNELKAYTDENTSKAIEIDIENLDYNFPYIRYAIVEHVHSMGQPTGVYYSDVISIQNTKFVYTGNNATTKGSIEEVTLTKATIDIQKAAHIEQIENRLILANTQSKQVKAHILQKYASKIQTDCVVKEVNLNELSDLHNTKNPLLAYNGIGYQPGEVYSFGVIYYYKSGGVSPVFHIPGKGGSEKISNKTYLKGENIFPMSNKDNSNINTTYTTNQTCNKEDFWGRDCEGNLLEGSLVRHHRFPTRKELGIPLIKESKSIGGEEKFQQLIIEVNVDPEGVQDDSKTIEIKLEYKLEPNGNILEDNVYLDPKNPSVINLTSKEIFRNKQLYDVKILYRKVDEQNFTQISFNQTSKVRATDGSSITCWESEKKDNIYTFEYYYGFTRTTSNLENIYTSYILGVKFSNITLPSKEDLGEEIIGYQIVRLNRDINDRTIIDTGVIFPILNSGKYESTGLLIPHTLEGGGCNAHYNANKIISKKSCLLVNPEYKFKNLSPDNFTTIEEDGYFELKDRTYDALYVENMFEYTSTTGDDSNQTKDNDGSDLKNLIRYNKVEYIEQDRNNKFILERDKVRLYSLNALEFSTSYDEKNEIFNLAQDNTALVLSAKEEIFNLHNDPKKIPYVIIKNEHRIFYQNFRNRPYQIVSNKIFNNTTETTTLFGGDCYISPMRYTNHIYSGFVGRRLAKKIGAWKVIGSVLSIVTGIASFFIPGLQGLSATLVSIGAGALVAGGGLMLASTYIEANALEGAYSNKWKAGLEQATMDWDYQRWLVNPDPYPNACEYNTYNKRQEDTFQWFTDIVGDLWFESQYNISLRSSSKNFVWSYLKPLKPHMKTNHSNLRNISTTVRVKDRDLSVNKYWMNAAGTTTPLATPEMNFVFHKILRNSQTKEKGVKYEYFGTSIPQVYILNADYNLNKRVRNYFQLPLTYDFCSDCIERFPHRVHYSQQSFQEEKTDNYRQFLPNNYRDIEGETGEITNIFRLNNQLYIHTEEALWVTTRSHQERVTDQIVSFIGTGSYFEIPPQKLIDDDTGHSAGTQHKWASLKTPVGYFFISENQKKIYLFDGKSPKAISDKGISKWFENNIETNKGTFYISNNPSNKLGTGYISTYDSYKERFIFTKKNHTLDISKLNLPENTYIDVESRFFFLNYEQTIKDYLDKGFKYKGIKGSEMIFEKEVLRVKKDSEENNIFKDADYVLFRYNFAPNTGGRDLDIRFKMLKPIESLEYGWQSTSNKEGLNSSEYLKWGGDNVNYGREVLLLNIKKLREDFPKQNILLKCGAWWFGEKHGGKMNINAEAYKGGEPKHTAHNFEFIIEGGEKLGDTSFPLETVHNEGGFVNPEPIGEFIYHVSNGDLEWIGKSTASINGSIIEDTKEETYYTELIIEKVPGFKLEMSDWDKTIVNKDEWTVSFSQDITNWISFHSYKPNMYIHIPNKFFSWKYDTPNNSIWRHNIEGSYQTFYNEFFPHIIEYISVSSPLTTRLWDTISIQGECREYEDNDFVDNRYITFNKGIFYNSRQCSGELELKVKNDLQDQSEYLWGQVSTNSNISVIDRTERNWFINDFRDLRINYTKPIWLETKDDYHYILNTNTLSYDKHWSEQENFRDKYLGIRFIFDKFANKKLITHYSVEQEQQSLY